MYFHSVRNIITILLVSIITLSYGSRQIYGGRQLALKKKSWSYDGTSGPSHWSQLNTNYIKCNVGKYQSPVDLSSEVMLHTSTFPKMIMSPFNKLEVKTNEHTIQWTPQNDGQTRIWYVNNDEYTLAQFHVHTPSEHWIDNKYYDGEVHFVHQTKNGKLAVLGIFIEATPQDNPRWTNILSRVPKYGHSNMVDLLLETDEIIQLSKNGYYRYKGSLTTPPCSEGVEWFVMVKPIRLSINQIRMISNIIGFSARPIQMNEDVLHQFNVMGLKD